MSKRQVEAILKKTGKTWTPDSIRSAPFPHSGHPELLAVHGGPVLHIASGGISWTIDGGNHWHDAYLGELGYYPRAVQLDDGRILCVYHQGGDNGYGDVDQSIEVCTFRLASE